MSFPSSGTVPLPMYQGRLPVVSHGFDGGKHLGADLDYRAVAGDPAWTGRDTYNRTRAYYSPTRNAALAAADGVVERVESTKRGWAVYISHGDGWTTRYRHLVEAYVHEGQAVEEGEQVGETGGDPSTAARFIHLHFEVYRDEAQDPERWMSEWKVRNAKGEVVKTRWRAPPATATNAEGGVIWIAAALLFLRR